MPRFALPAIGLLFFTLAGCGGDDTGDGALEPTYENVEATLVLSCAFSTSCHGGASRGQAALNIESAVDAGTLVEELMKPACEYSRMPRVDPGDPDNSWMMIKLTAPHASDGTIEFTPAADWTPDPGPHPATLCPLMDGSEVYFGTLMPQISPFAGLPDREITMIRQWIEMGAPGPAM